LILFQIKVQLVKETLVFSWHKKFDVDIKKEITVISNDLFVELVQLN